MQKIDVLKKDYERYFFPLPAGKAWGLRKKKYVFSELEKRHPCFSDEYAFDVVLKPGRKGIFSDVVVVKKIKLAECRKKIAGLKLEDCKGKRFRRIDGKKVLLPGFLLLVFLSLLIGNKSNHMRGRTVTEEVSFLPQREVKSSAQSENKDEFLENLFLIIRNEKGTISDFLWKTNPSGHELSVTLKSLYPEKLGSFIEKGKVSSIVYVNGKPEFSYSRQFNIGSEEPFRTVPKTNQFQKEIRKIILENECKITEENFIPYCVKFSYEKNPVTGKSEKFKVFLRLKELFEALGISVESIRLKMTELNGEYKYDAELLVNTQASYESGIDISILSLYQDVFISERNMTQQIATTVRKEVSMEKENTSYKKIGEVIHADGTRLIFYKDQNGKLKTRKVES